MRLYPIVLICLLMGFLNPLFAATSPCVLLGSQPSLMIKLNHQLSSTVTNSSLSSATLTLLSDTAKLNFTTSRAMAQGYYILKFQPINQYHACYPKEFIDTVIKRLKNLPDVNNVASNTLLHLASVPTPILQQWHLSTNTAAGGINAPTAWAITSGNPNAIVAVIDDGILTNASLALNLLSSHAASFYNAGTVTTGDATQCPTGCDAGDTEHGTHTSGLVASSGNGSYGENVYGVAYTGNVLPINVFTKFTYSEDCSPDAPPCLAAYTSDIDNALNWLAGRATFPALGTPPNIVAVSMSLGGSGACDDPTQEAFDQLYFNNVTIVVAAGNGNTSASDTTPANCNDVIPVVATGPTDLKAYYSNYGQIASIIAAPGGDYYITSSNASLIYSTVNEGYDYLQGTSMATPLVAGLVSLLYSVDPTMTPARALSYLQNQNNVTPFATGTGDNFCSNNPNNSQYCGPGIINAGAAVTDVYNNKPTLLWTPNFQINQTSPTSVILNWTAASWSNSATTPIIYTVAVNGTPYSNCTNITATSCTLNNLAENGLKTDVVNLSVSTTDSRSIYTPVTQSDTIYLNLTAATLTDAERNAANISEAYVYYSNAGSTDVFTSYTINGLSGVTVTLDPTNNRFVLNNISIDTQASISITGYVNPNVSATSNTITLPGIQAVAPSLTSAKRNPLLLSEGWVYYSNPGSYDMGNVFNVSELPGTTVHWDATNQRFVIDKITTGRATPIHISLTNPYGNAATSNQVTLPGILAP